MEWLRRLLRALPRHSTETVDDLEEALKEEQARWVASTKREQELEYAVKRAEERTRRVERALAEEQQTYRDLADHIIGKMSDPDEWDGDESELWVLMQFVEHVTGQLSYRQRLRWPDDLEVHPLRPDELSEAATLYEQVSVALNDHTEDPR